VRELTRVLMEAGPPAGCRWAGTLLLQFTPHSSIVRLFAVVAAA
jgi:hypothetical protein